MTRVAQAGCAGHANGAVSLALAWGNAPGFIAEEKSTERATHFRIPLRCGPSPPLKRAFSANLNGICVPGAMPQAHM